MAWQRLLSCLITFGQVGVKSQASSGRIVLISTSSQSPSLVGVRQLRSSRASVQLSLVVALSQQTTHTPRGYKGQVWGMKLCTTVAHQHSGDHLALPAARSLHILALRLEEEPHIRLAVQSSHPRSSHMWPMPWVDEGSGVAKLPHSNHSECCQPFREEGSSSRFPCKHAEDRKNRQRKKLAVIQKLDPTDFSMKQTVQLRGY